MTKRAQIYRSIILLLGLGLTIRQSLQWTPGNESIFLTYLGLTVLTSLLRLGVPTVAGTISVGFIFILASLAQLSIGQTITIGITGTIIHYLRDRRGRVDWLSLSFQTAVIVLGIEAASAAFHNIMERLPQGGVVAALPLAGSVLFMVTAFPLAATTALMERELLRRVWQNRFLWSLPYYLAGASLAGLLSVIIHLPWWQTAVVIVPLVFLVYRAYGLQIDALARERQHAEELASLQLSMVETLALAVESKDTTAIDHLHRMATFAVGLGREMGLDDTRIKSLRAAAVLHDIGQVAVPDHIIMKPGRLTPEEYERLKVHPDVGADIIERAMFPYPVAPIVREHHERWDGAGYPRGIRGETILLEARILAAVDTLVALTSDRHYRPAVPLEKAIEVVRKEAGVGLDPQVVATLCSIYKKLDEEARNTVALRNRAPGTAVPAGQQPQAANPEEVPAFLMTIAAARREEQSLLEFTQILGSSLNLQETLIAIARRFRRQIPFDTMVLYLAREKRVETVFIDGENYTLFSDLSIPFGEGISGRVAQSGKPMLNVDPSLEPATKRNPEKMARLHSALSVPLEGSSGLSGVLTLYAERKDAFSGTQMSLLLAISPKLALTVENSIRYSAAESQATNDFLTGLPNAGALFLHLQSELARASRNNARLAVIVSDLDGFKQVNDRFGHLTGNKLLQAVAQGLRDNCRDYDFVARLGGDEFVLILPGATEEAVRLRRRRLVAMTEQAGVELCPGALVTLSMGVSFYPEDGRSAEELLAKSDTRMYEDKAARKALRAAATVNTAHDWLSSTPHD